MKSVLVGLLATVLSVLATAIVLVAVLVKSQREIPIGPLYLLIPVAAFAGGYYWCWRRSSRPKPPASSPSITPVVVKSILAGVTATIIVVIACLVWVWSRIPHNVQGFVSIDVRLLRWPALLSFVAGLLLQYWWASRRRSRMTASMG